MPRLPLQSLIPVLVAVTVATSACSKGTSSSPLAPSLVAPPAAAAPAPAPVVSGANVSGIVLSGTPAAGLATQTLTTVGRVTISVNGTGLSALSDDNGVFSLQGVPAGSLTLTVTGTGFSVQVGLGTVNVNDDLRVTLRVSGNSATVDDTRHQSSDNQVELEGVVTTAAGGTITVGSANTVIAVPASAAITRGGTTAALADLVKGVRVEVHAVQSGQTLTATRVNIESGTEVGDDNGGASGHDSPSDLSEAKLSGTIASVAIGGCPAISLVVGTTTIVTNRSTNFDDVSCASLAQGDSISVEGTRQANGSVLARELKRTSGSTSSGSGSNSGSNSGSGSSSGSNSGSSGGSGSSGHGSGGSDDGSDDGRGRSGSRGNLSEPSGR